MTAPPLLGLTRQQLEQVLTDAGQPAFRGRQIAEWLYRHGIRTFAEITNLPKSLRERLDADWVVGRSHLLTTQQASDGTVKYLLEEPDGERLECVLIPESGRATACVSSQAGCPIGCPFCATGLMGPGRNLTPGEILDQVLTVREGLKTSSPEDLPSSSPGTSSETPALTHVVFMGMGEPLLNFNSVLTAVHLLHEEMGLSRRRITLSTVGIVPKIHQLAREKIPVTLAVSLHAPDDALRRRLVPLSGRRWPLRELLEAIQDFSWSTGRQVTFEYVLLEGVNDRRDQAEQLVSLLRGFPCHLNLIPFNPVPGLPFRRPGGNRVRVFRQILQEQGLSVTQRFERGADIAAACGQLKTEGATKS